MKRRDEVTVGILVTIAVAVLLIGTLWLVRGGLSNGYPLYTRFQWGQNLKQGQPVLLAGVSVGHVDDVTLRRDGYLDVMLRIDDDQTVPKGSTAQVKPVGIFGDVSVALNPPTPVPAANYSPGDTVPPGPPTPDIGQIMSRVDSIGASVQLLSHALEVEVVQAGTLRDIHKTVASAAALAATLQSVAAQQSRNLSLTMASFRNAADKLNRSVDSVQIAATMENLRVTSANATHLSASLDSSASRLNTILVRLDRGEGTAGKLLRDSLMYADLRNLVHTTDSLLADFKRNPRKYINLSIF